MPNVLKFSLHVNKYNKEGRWRTEADLYKEFVNLVSLRIIVGFGRGQRGHIYFVQDYSWQLPPRKYNSSLNLNYTTWSQLNLHFSTLFGSLLVFSSVDLAPHFSYDPAMEKIHSLNKYSTQPKKVLHVILASSNANILFTLKPSTSNFQLDSFS